MNDSSELTELRFTLSARVAKPRAETYEAVADPEQLSRYFTTTGARGRLEAGNDVRWSFPEAPEGFPITVVEADPPHRIVIRWENLHALADDGHTTVTFEFESDGDGTLVTVTEASWRATPDGAAAAFDNSGGWMQMLCALKAWLEHGINIRD